MTTLVLFRTAMICSTAFMCTYVAANYLAFAVAVGSGNATAAEARCALTNRTSLTEAAVCIRANAR